MADSKVSALPLASALSGIEQLMIVQAQSKRISVPSISAISLIAEQLLGVDTSIVTFSSIPATPFRHLILKIYGRHSEAVSDNYVLMRLNNDSGANYDFQHGLFINVTSSLAATYAQTHFRISDFPGNNSTRATQAGFAEVFIPHYAGTTFEKLMIAHGGATVLTAGNGTLSQINSGGWRNIAAINRLDIFPTSGNFKAGSLFSLYGSF